MILVCQYHSMLPNILSFKAKPFMIYSLSTLVAQILNSVAFLELTRYPTAIMASRLYIFTSLVWVFSLIAPGYVVFSILETTMLSFSSSSTIFLKCFDIAGTPTSKTLAIPFCVSHKVSSL